MGFLSKKPNQENKHKPSVFSTLDWQDFVCVGLIAAMFIANFILLSSFKSLPSPIYGGDYYNHLGTMEHIAAGGNIFESGQLAGEIPWVPWLYHIIVVGFAKLFGLALIPSVFGVSLLLLVVGCVIAYLLGSMMFSNKTIGLIAVLWQGAHFPLFKYSPFAFWVVLPLFFLAAFLFFKHRTWKYALFLGIMYGLAGLANTHSFIVSSMFLAFFFLYYVILENVLKKENKNVFNKKLFWVHLQKAIFIFVLGFIIAMLWWYKPIFVYHAHTPNDMQVYGIAEMSTTLQMLQRIPDGLSLEFFQFNNIFVALLKLGAFIGLILLFFVRNKKTEHKFLIILSIAALFGLVSHLILIPLFGINLVPLMLFDTFMVVTTLLLFLFFIRLIVTYAENRAKILGPIIIGIVFILAAYNVYANMHDLDSGQYGAMAKEQLPDMLMQTQVWVKQNTNVNTVFLTTNEDGFALNALTGRKMVTYRRTHAPSYTDMNQRMLDAGIMLYGNNDQERNILFQKYNVSYLYWEPRWIFNEFNFDQQGKLQGFFDPLMIDYSPGREQTLKYYNITYVHTQWWLDPAFLESYPKRDVLVIIPSRLDLEKPWNPMLDKYLVLEKQIIEQNQNVTKIFKIVQP